MASREKRKPEARMVWSLRKQSGPAALRPEAARSVARAVLHYGVRLRHGVNTPRADGDLRGQLSRFEHAHVQMQQREQAVKQILCARGESVCLFIHYQNFCRHVARVTDQHDSETRYQLAAEAVARWVSMGLRLSVLEEICTQVLDIRMPRETPKPAGACAPRPGCGIISGAVDSLSCGTDRPEGRPASRSSVNSVPDGESTPEEVGHD